MWGKKESMDVAQNHLYRLKASAHEPAWLNLKRVCVFIIFILLGPNLWKKQRKESFMFAHDFRNPLYWRRMDKEIPLVAAGMWGRVAVHIMADLEAAQNQGQV